MDTGGKVIEPPEITNRTREKKRMNQEERPRGISLTANRGTGERLMLSLVAMVTAILLFAKGSALEGEGSLIAFNEIEDRWPRGR